MTSLLRPSAPRALVAALPCLLTACAAHSPVDRDELSRRVAGRTGGVPLRPAAQAAQQEAALPPGIDLGRPITEDEAAGLALWNDPGFQADLGALGVARADLVEAGMIRNPLLTLLLPLGPKQLELTATLPLEALWQRPRKVAAAQAEVERVAESLVQSALDVARNARLACVDQLLARDRARLAEEALGLRRRIATIAQGRLAAGDISRAEATLVLADAELAASARQQALAEVESASDRLRQALGLVGAWPTPLVADAPPQARPVGDLPALIKQALAARPDLRAAELTIEAAAARAGWERSRILNQVAAVVDANGAGKEGFEIGPGLQIELPLFHANGAAVDRARVEVQRAAWRYTAVRQRVENEVRLARRQYLASREALQALRARVLPGLREAVAGAEQALAEGNESQLFALEVTRRLVDVQAQEAELQAALRRAAAELDRSVGRKLVEVPHKP